MKTAIIIAIIFSYSFFIAFILKQKPHHIPLLCDNILKEIRDEQREFERKMREIRLEKEQNKEVEEIHLEKKKKGCEHLVGMYCLKKEKGIPVEIYEIKEYIDNSFYLCEEDEPNCCLVLVKLESLEGYKFFETHYSLRRYIDYWQSLVND